MTFLSLGKILFFLFIYAATSSEFVSVCLLIRHMGFFSEFDIAGVVVFVGEVYTTAHKKKQWVFVTDGSIHDSHSKEPSYSLLAISFCSPYIDCESYMPINFNLAGSTVSSRWVASPFDNILFFFFYSQLKILVFIRIYNMMCLIFSFTFLQINLHN